MIHTFTPNGMPEAHVQNSNQFKNHKHWIVNLFFRGWCCGVKNIQLVVFDTFPFCYLYPNMLQFKICKKFSQHLYYCTLFLTLNFENIED